MALPRTRPSLSGVFHCMSRCVRGAALCGRDGDHRRKDLIYHQMRRVADAFAVVIGDSAIMTNHLHIVVKIMPEWSKT